MISLKFLLIFIAVIFTALGFKSSLPLATTNLHLLWNFFLLCFTPPYLFFTVNAIIISILASSKFHQSKDQAVEEVTKEIDLGNLLPEIINSPDNLPPVDKPLVSSRFIHRKPLKSTPEGGKALKVAAKQKRHETLENTWKTITEGRSIPLSRHMKKCDTWQNRYDAGPHQPEDSVSEFNLNKTVRLRKEPSLSQDELNKRVETFIRNFNHQMRLQREESLLNHYNNMINRGAS
ncbi:uncharacterized protein LOC127115908 [Lathyrus oleraceus]|uniref:DUF4408 domain-containing protein n=1 Tax=Pisum sativum TaxID=3888 RepID=A0A9D5H0S4_PEA|nr:uncharacterized protein LOC127115908 [Pisum sativum]KAI5448126.1 hypothetical protein KIW84_015523 [Pisum sativum]